MADMSKSKIKRKRVYYTEADVPKDINPIDEVIIYDKLDKIRNITQSGVRGLGFGDYSKEEYALNWYKLTDNVEKLERELKTEIIKNKLMLKKLHEHNIEAHLTPDEIKEYRAELSVLLNERIDDVCSGGLKSIKEEVLYKVKTAISEIEQEYTDSLEYNLIRVSTHLKLNDLLLMEISKSLMDKSKKAKAMCDLEKSSREYISVQREIEKDLAKVVKVEESNPKLANDSGFTKFGGLNSINYSGETDGR